MLTPKTSLEVAVTGPICRVAGICAPATLETRTAAYAPSLKELDIFIIGCEKDSNCHYGERISILVAPPPPPPPAMNSAPAGTNPPKGPPPVARPAVPERIDAR